MSNYQSALARINGAKTRNELEKVSTGINRVYHANFLTVHELMKLDQKIVEKSILLDWEQE